MNGNLIYKRKNRKVVKIEEYFKILKEKDYSSYDIYIVSEEQLKLAFEKEFPTYSFFQSTYLDDKSVIWSDTQYEDLERYCYNHPEQIEDVATSSLLDLWILSHCHEFLGPVDASAFTQCGYQIACGKQKKLLPFTDLVKYDGSPPPII
jgi:hypothetical protein